MMASWPSVQHWRRYIASRDGTVGPSSGMRPPTCISSDHRKRKPNGMASFGSAIGAMTSAARNCAIICLFHASRPVWTWTFGACVIPPMPRSEEHTSELQSLMRISYAVFCLKKKNTSTNQQHQHNKNPTCNHHTHIHKYSVD